MSAAHRLIGKLLRREQTRRPAPLPDRACPALTVKGWLIRRLASAMMTPLMSARHSFAFGV